MTFHGLYGIPHRSWGSEEVEQNEEKIRENIETLTRQNPLLGKTLDLMMDYSNYHDSITFEMAYNDAQVLIDRSRANLEADLRNCVEEVAKNYAEYETSELNRKLGRALERHNKDIDRLFSMMYRRENDERKE